VSILAVLGFFILFAIERKTDSIYLLRYSPVREVAHIEPVVASAALVRDQMKHAKQMPLNQAAPVQPPDLPAPTVRTTPL
jgi:hypothetical protein